MRKTRLVGGAAVIALSVVAQPALAQTAEVGEVVVTARKRVETILNVPVVETVVSKSEMESRQLLDLREVSRMVPGLALAEASGSLGTRVSLRGVGTTAINVTIDASVSLNVDGLQLTQSTAYTAAMFDLERIEVLKGPQSLFYGKNSPGGVIAIRTADPTSTFELSARSGYEFEADQFRNELIISGPVSETLKLRLAGLYDRQAGFFKNTITAFPGLGIRNPTNRSGVTNKNWILRGTALWQPSADLSARLKLTVSHDNTTEGDTHQMVSCPDGTGPVPFFGIPFIGPNEDCKLNRTISAPYLDPAAFPGVPNGGVPFKKLDQVYGTLELNYTVAPKLTLSSTTAYYHSIFKNVSAVSTYTTPFIGVAKLPRMDFTQEFRLESDYDKPVNFMVGAFFQDGRIGNIVDLPTNRVFPLPPRLAAYMQFIDIKAYSLFGQVRWQVDPKLELSAGARWTDEKRKMVADSLNTGVKVFFPIKRPKISSNNIAPEFTATYKPSEDVTLFGSYKVAYKSGSFDTTVLLGTLPDYAFGDEKGRGAEVGVKARMLERSLLMNFAVYDYRYRGLQVGVLEPFTGGAPVNRTLNAGSARVYGAEWEVTFAPRAVEGLTLQGALAYNHARFKDLKGVPCWDGQMISEGCNTILNPTTGLFTAQDLSGTRLVAAPTWQADFGFSYQRPIGEKMSLRFTNSNQYSSGYLTYLGTRADFYRKGFFKTDASLELHGPDERWELALIGKNLGNKITTGNCTAGNAANGQVFPGAITGGTTRGPAGVAEVSCFPDRGRELWVRVTLRPFAR